MSNGNSTSLQIGMFGTFAGRRYRIAGRVRMSMSEAGETYYWNEFNLESDDGDSATLVFEDTVWRFFSAFEPEFPMTAADAATKRVGDALNFDGTNVRVTLVGDSRVRDILGKAPEGVEVGDVAHYFNTQGDGQMQVVSWTGDEVEFYRGITLSRKEVETAFGISNLESSDENESDEADESDESDESASSYLSSSGGTVSLSDTSKALVALAGIAVLVICCYSYWSGGSRTVPSKVAAPVTTLAPGREGKLDGTTYRIRSRTVVEWAEDGRTFDCHEYRIVDADQNLALLICGLTPGKKEWLLFLPLQPLAALTPLEAAKYRVGETVNVDGYVAPVSRLVQSTVTQIENADAVTASAGEVSYGFIARSANTILLVRWNQGGIVYYRSKASPIEDVEKAFGGK